MPDPEKIPGRLPSFAVSALLHCGFATLIAFLPGASSHDPAKDRADTPVRYSVQLIHLSLPPYVPEHRVQPKPAAAGTLVLKRSAASAEPSPSAGAPAAPLERRAASVPFVMPKPVRQTLVRPDVPPEITLKQEVPLPDLLPSDLKVPAFHRQFVMPPPRPAQKTTPAVSAAAPAIAGPALTQTDLKIVAKMAELPRLPVPRPQVAQPAAVQSPGQSLVQRSAAPAPEPVAASSSGINVLSVSENPAAAADLLAIPPANQIASGGKAGVDGTHEGGSGTAGSGSSGGKSRAATGSGPDSNAKGVNEGLTASLGIAAGPNPGSGAGKEKSGTGFSGNAPDLGGSLLALPGTTELNFPKEGKYGVVVSGSTAAAPYPESAGALSGRIVYTVYLRVGQRKNWILQYCLPKTAGSTSRTRSSAPALEAPFPYNIVRPDHAGDSQYVLVRGMVTVEGRFDQLAMVFPQNPEGKDLLIQALNRWTFRPAKRDGEPAAVEVLLIIPREGE